MKTAFKEYYDDDIEMIYGDGLKRHCYPILAGVIFDYKVQVLITRIKTNVQCSVCHILLQEHKNLTKTWPLWIHKSIWSQIEQQINDLIKQRDKISGNCLHLR